MWITEVWEWILGQRSSLPAWSKEFALTRFTVSTARVSDWFRRYNQEQSAGGRVRPGSFGLLAHPSSMFRSLSGEVLPAAPYDRNPRQWPGLPWYDRRTGERLRVVAPTGLSPEDWSDLGEGLELVDSLADAVARYRLRPEHKSLASDGSRTHGESRGLLGRRPVLAAPVLTDLVGKEGNRVLERLTGEVTDVADYRNAYGSRGDRWSLLVRPVLREMGSTDVARRTGLSRSAVERAIRPADASTPHGSSKAKYLQATKDWILERSTIGIEGSPLGVLFHYIRRSQD